MSENYGFAVTVAGRALLASLLAGERLTITRVMVGDGNLGDASPFQLKDLIAPVAQATSTTPVHKDDTVSFTVEYRSDLNGGLERDFWLSEFGVFALDKDGNEILLYYATLGDYPQAVRRMNGSGQVDIRRFPVTLVVSDEVEVTINYFADAFMTSENIVEYTTTTLLPLLLEEMDKRLSDHNLDPGAHPPLRLPLEELKSRVEKIEKMLSADITKNQFTVLFVDLEELIIKSGVWNEREQRLEF